MSQARVLACHNARAARRRVQLRADDESLTNIARGFRSALSVARALAKYDANDQSATSSKCSAAIEHVCVLSPTDTSWWEYFSHERPSP